MNHCPRVILLLCTFHFLLSACVGFQSRSFQDAQSELESPPAGMARVVFFQVRPDAYAFADLQAVQPGPEAREVEAAVADPAWREAQARALAERFADAPRVESAFAGMGFFAWTDVEPGRHTFVFPDDDAGECGLPLELEPGETRYVHYFPREAYYKALQSGELVLVGVTAASVTAIATMSAVPTTGGGVAIASGPAAPLLIVPVLAMLAVYALSDPAGPCDHYELVMAEVPQAFALEHLPGLRHQLGWSWEIASKEE